MSLRNKILFLLLTVFLSWQSNEKVSSQTEKLIAGERPRFALLVGINEYKNSANPPVPGAENDVDLIKRVLTDREKFAFPDDPEHLRVLKTKTATRKDIEAGFEFLKRKAKENKDKNPIIVFYFSGHGTQYKNQDYDTGDNDRLDGMDEALVPYDSRETGVYDILDDEIDDLSAELAEYSSDILYIFDSCHSGTASRGDPARETEPNPRNGERTAFRRQHEPVDKNPERAKKIVQLAAALPHESAYPRQDRSNGVMTWHLAAALSRASRQTTYQQLMREVRAGVQSEGTYAQHPFADGDELRPVLGEGSKRADPFFNLLGQPENGKVKFAAGKLYGVQEGSLVAIYDQTATKFVGGVGFLTYASVESVSERESIAVLPDEKVNPKVKQINKDSRLVLVAPTFGGKPLALILDNNLLNPPGFAPANIRAEIDNSFKEKDEYKILLENKLIELSDQAGWQKRSAKDKPETALQLRRGKFGDVFRNPARLRLPTVCPDKDQFFPAPETEIYYLQSDVSSKSKTPMPLFGRFFKADDPAAAADEILKAVNVYARQRNLINLENANSSLNERVTVERTSLSYMLAPACPVAQKSKVYQGWTCAGEKTPDIKNNQIPQNSVSEVTVSNITNDPSLDRSSELFVAVLLVTSDGKIQLLNDAELLNPLTKANPLKSLLIANQPAGGDTVKVVITTNKNDLEGLRFLTVPEWQTRATKGIQTPLEKLLSQSGTRSRGNPTLSPSDPNSWGVKTIDWVVMENKYTCPCSKKITVYTDGSEAKTEECGSGS